MQYNAKAASNATGIAEETLKTWERRYGVPKPQRSETGWRQYTDEDLALIRRMAQLLDSGMSASNAARALTESQGPPTQTAYNRQLLLMLSKVAAHFPNGSINIFDRELRYIFADGLGLAAIGLSPEMLIGHTIAELFPPDSAAYVVPYYMRAFAGESVQFKLEVAGHTYLIATGPLDVIGDEVRTIIAVAQDLSQPLAPI